MFHYDSLLWEVIYKGYAKKVMKASSKDKKIKKAEKKAEKIPEKPGLAFWKNYCVHKLVYVGDAIKYILNFNYDCF